MYDLVAESWRSPTLAALALLSAVLSIAVNVVGYFTGLSVPQCWVGAATFPDGQALLASTLIPLKTLAVLMEVLRVVFPLALLAAAGASAGVGCAAFYGSMVCGPGMHMAWQVSTLDPRDARNCAERFRSNAAFGGLAAAAIAVGAAASSA